MRARLDLNIELPIGTEDGGFTVQFRNNNNESIAEITGTATWDGTAEALKVKADLRNVPAGSYTVVIQSRNSSVRFYPVVLE
jgi:peptidyl-tRNA hydrolase